MLADEFILNLDRVKLEEKNLLPDYSGIYYVIDRDNLVWYVGRSSNLQRRWNHEKPHHRFRQLQEISERENQQFFIYYESIPIKKLRLRETRQIVKYRPRLNYTPVIKYVRKNVETTSYLATDNYILKIISDYNSSNIEIEEIESDRPELIMMTETEQTQEPEITEAESSNLSNVPLKEFKRRFIYLKNEEIGLNKELEICIDSRNRLFVRHYNLCNIYSWSISIINNQTDDIIKDYLSRLNSRCSSLYEYSLRWLGYKLSCEEIILIDEEDDFEIETLAIMLPFRMFVDLVEYLWLKDLSLGKNLQEQEAAWFKKQPFSTKLAKWLHDHDMTLSKLVEQLK